MWSSKLTIMECYETVKMINCVKWSQSNFPNFQSHRHGDNNSIAENLRSGFGQELFDVHGVVTPFLPPPELFPLGVS